MALHVGIIARRRFMLGGSGAAPDTYAVLGNSPDVVADFESATEYFRVGGVETTFTSMFGVPATTAYPTSLRTMVDSSGNLKWGPHNYVPSSADMSGIDWVANNCTKTGGQSDPFGGSSATLITLTSSANRIADSISPLGSIVTCAVFAKNGTTSPTDWILVYGQGTNNGAWFDLATGSLGATQANILASRITDIGDGWYLCEIDVNNATAPVGGAEARGCSGNSVSTGVIGETYFLCGFHVYRSDLGGMADVPTDQRVASGAAFATYVPTTTAARYLHRRGNHVYNGSSWVKKGILLETEARTNLLLNSGTLATQNVTTSATPYTLSFTGTGTVTLSGTSTAGPLVGTGTGENNRVNLTFTPTAGTLTLTVSGTVTNAQLEAGSTPSSHIPTAGATVTRTAEASLVPIANVPTIGSVHLKGTITYADTGAESQHTLWRQYKDADEYIVCDIDTDSTDTGEINFEQNNAGTLGTVTSDSLSPGVNVAFNVASRHGGSVVNGAVAGTAGTAITTASTLPTFTTESFSMAHAMNGNVSLLRVWDTDILDAGIEAAST